MAGLTHLDDQGQPGMVDISAKPVVRREAVAEGFIEVSEAVRGLLEGGELMSAKGPVFQTAILAGTMGAKRCPELIPLCHGLALDDCKFDICLLEDGRIRIECKVATAARTGVEMEALTGVSVAALTIYDMCKAVDKEMRITDQRLVSKSKTPIQVQG